MMSSNNNFLLKIHMEEDNNITEIFLNKERRSFTFVNDECVSDLVISNNILDKLNEVLNEKIEEETGDDDYYAEYEKDGEIVREYNRRAIRNLQNLVTKIDINEFIENIGNIKINDYYIDNIIDKYSSKITPEIKKILSYTTNGVVLEGKDTYYLMPHADIVNYDRKVNDFIPFIIKNGKNYIGYNYNDDLFEEYLNKEKISSTKTLGELVLGEEVEIIGDEKPVVEDEIEIIDTDDVDNKIEEKDSPVIFTETQSVDTIDNMNEQVDKEYEETIKNIDYQLDKLLTNVEEKENKTVPVIKTKKKEYKPSPEVEQEIRKEVIDSLEEIEKTNRIIDEIDNDISETKIKEVRNNSDFIKFFQEYMHDNKDKISEKMFTDFLIEFDEVKLDEHEANVIKDFLTTINRNRDEGVSFFDVLEKYMKRETSTHDALLNRIKKFYNYQLEKIQYEIYDEFINKDLILSKNDNIVNNKSKVKESNKLYHEFKKEFVKDDIDKSTQRKIGDFLTMVDSKENEGILFIDVLRQEVLKIDNDDGDWFTQKLKSFYDKNVSKKTKNDKTSKNLTKEKESNKLYHEFKTELVKDNMDKSTQSKIGDFFTMVDNKENEGILFVDVLRQEVLKIDNDDGDWFTQKLKSFYDKNVSKKTKNDKTSKNLTKEKESNKLYHEFKMEFVKDDMDKSTQERLKDFFLSIEQSEKEGVLFIDFLKKQIDKIDKNETDSLKKNIKYFWDYQVEGMKDKINEDFVEQNEIVNHDPNKERESRSLYRKFKKTFVRDDLDISTQNIIRDFFAMVDRKEKEGILFIDILKKEVEKIEENEQDELKKEIKEFYNKNANKNKKYENIVFDYAKELESSNLYHKFKEEFVNEKLDKSSQEVLKEFFAMLDSAEKEGILFIDFLKREVNKIADDDSDKLKQKIKKFYRKYVENVTKKQQHICKKRIKAEEESNKLYNEFKKEFVKEDIDKTDQERLKDFFTIVESNEQKGILFADTLQKEVSKVDENEEDELFQSMKDFYEKTNNIEKKSDLNRLINNAISNGLDNYQINFNDTQQLVVKHLPYYEIPSSFDVIQIPEIEIDKITLLPGDELNFGRLELTVFELNTKKVDLLVRKATNIVDEKDIKVKKDSHLILDLNNSINLRLNKNGVMETWSFSMEKSTFEKELRNIDYHKTMNYITSLKSYTKLGNIEKYELQKSVMLFINFVMINKDEEALKKLYKILLNNSDLYEEYITKYNIDSASSLKNCLDSYEDKKEYVSKLSYITGLIDAKWLDYPRYIFSSYKYFEEDDLLEDFLEELNNNLNEKDFYNYLTQLFKQYNMFNKLDEEGKVNLDKCLSYLSVLYKSYPNIGENNKYRIEKEFMIGASEEDIALLISKLCRKGIKDYSTFVEYDVMIKEKFRTGELKYPIFSESFEIDEIRNGGESDEY